MNCEIDKHQIVLILEQNLAVRTIYGTKGILQRQRVPNRRSNFTKRVD